MYIILCPVIQKECVLLKLDGKDTVISHPITNLLLLYGNFTDFLYSQHSLCMLWCRDPENVKIGDASEYHVLPAS